MRRAAALPLVLALLAGCERAPEPVPAPVAEFIVAAADSVFWIRSEADGIRVRGAPMVLAQVGGRFSEIYAADDLPEAHHDDEPLGFWRRMPPLGALPGGTDTPLPVVDLLVPESLLPYWWERITDAGATMAGSWAYDALRVAALRPEIDVDTDDRTIPHEAGWIGGWLRSAVHLHKGCYRGQEAVARVHNLGNPPRRLVFLHLDGSGHVLPERGAEVFVAGMPSGRAIGVVTSVARHAELGPIALALVKRSTPVDAALVVADGAGGPGIAAAQEVIVAP